MRFLKNHFNSFLPETILRLTYFQEIWSYKFDNIFCAAITRIKGIVFGLHVMRKIIPRCAYFPSNKKYLECEVEAVSISMQPKRYRHRWVPCKISLILLNNNNYLKLKIYNVQMSSNYPSYPHLCGNIGRWVWRLHENQRLLKSFLLLKILKINPCVPSSKTGSNNAYKIRNKARAKNHISILSQVSPHEREWLLVFSDKLQSSWNSFLSNPLRTCRICCPLSCHFPEWLCLISG